MLAAAAMERKALEWLAAGGHIGVLHSTTFKDYAPFTPEEARLA